MESKVYLLTDMFLGEVRTLAIFSTRAAAEAALCFGGKEAAIEEFTLDPVIPEAPPGHSLWYVVEEEEHSLTTIRTHAFEPFVIGHVEPDGDELTVHVWARDEAHALLAGAEEFARFKAEH